MKKILLLSLTLSLPLNVYASTFTCEQIKDKATQKACISDSSDKEKEAEVAKAKAETNAAESELNEFVRKSKVELTKFYKDPSSAQFDDLVVVDSSKIGWKW